MPRPPTFKERETIGITLEAEELKAFDEIRWREHKERTKLGRDAILEYIKSHSEGNDTFKLDNWNDDPNFQAVPTIFSDREKWITYYQDSNEKDRMRLRIQAVDLSKIFRNIDFNENRK